MPEYPKPLPVPDADTRPFWEGTKKHELRIQRCQSCRSFFFYPRSVCPKCHSQQLEWVRVSGKAQLYSYAIVHRATNAGFAPDVPYTYVIVQLEEGPRMISNVVQCPLNGLRIGMPLEVTFEDVTVDVTLPKFKPAAGG